MKRISIGHELWALTIIKNLVKLGEETDLDEPIDEDKLFEIILDASQHQLAVLIQGKYDYERNNDDRRHLIEHKPV